MIDIMNILMLVTIVIIAVLHFISFISRSAIVNVACIAFHVIALVPLIYFSAKLDLVAALSMLSLALRCASFFFVKRIKGEDKKL